MLCVWWAMLAAALCTAARSQATPAQPRCVHAAADRCRAGYQASNNARFTVNGVTVMYGFKEGHYFALTCPPGVALDEPALPVFEPALRVLEVRLECPPPSVSYAAALHALNVTSLDSRGPTYIIKLYLNKVMNLDPTVLAALPRLRSLTLFETNFTSTDLASLPPGLELLELRRTCIGRVPAAALSRLARLVKLVVQEKAPVEVYASGILRSLSVSSPASLVSSALPDTLTKLTLWGWARRRPEPWLSCAGLETLRSQFAAAETLPDGWLSRCVRLRTLHMETAKNLTTLAAGALRGATALEVVWFEGCALEALPEGLLEDAQSLRELYLSNNRLHTLPGELFRRSALLSELHLNSNSLTGAVLDSLTALTSLSELHLEDNPALDACPFPSEGGAMPDTSPLRELMNLTVLRLGRTDTRRVCADWRRLPRLRKLGLYKTPITRLTYADLCFNSSEDIKVDLYGTHVSRLELRREDYERGTASSAGPTITLLLGEPLRCDCQLYWTAAALRHRNSRLQAVAARCEDRRELRSVSLEELVCAAPGPCPDHCTCVTREHEAAPGPLLRLDCAGAGLRLVPRVDARATLRYTGEHPIAIDMRLAGNSIDRLRPEDLPPEITALDLRNNSLGLIDAATAAVLVSQAGRRVWLAGNPLECGCRAAAALAAVREHPAVFRDWRDGTCSDGTELMLAKPPSCDDGNEDKSMNVSESSTAPGPQSVPNGFSGGMSGGAVAALVLGSAAVVLLGLVLVRPSLRRRLQRALPGHPSVLRLERRRPADDEWLYDAFVSFAHADEAVVCELVERLEGGAAPLRLCVHYRDWMPGGWIPEQIAASVRVSRRTVAVVSEAFLRSKWARAEFREAYAAAVEDNEPRLVLVLLEDPARLQLDSELSAYVSGNTYVRWGDPWFWRKLRRALPAPIPRPPAESPTEGPRASPPQSGPEPQPGPTPSLAVSPAECPRTMSPQVEAWAQTTPRPDPELQSGPEPQPGPTPPPGPTPQTGPAPTRETSPSGT